jgi:hypothetical protein
MLPEKETVFDFDFIAESGKKYDGQFVVKAVLTIGQKHMLELEKTRLLGNYSNPTDDLLGLAIMLANLRMKIVKAPEWWNQSAGGYDIQDEDALIALYNRIRQAEDEWKSKLKTKAEAVQKKDEANSASSNP